MRFLSFLIIFSILSGCARFALPTFSGSTLPDAERAYFTSLVTQRSNELSSFKALLRAKLAIGSDRSSVRYMLLAELPSKLHLEALAPNAAYAMAVLVADAQRMLLLDPAPRRAYIGSSDAAHVKRALNIPLQPEWLISLVLGRLPASYLEVFAGAQVEAKRSTELAQIIVKQGEFERFFVFNAQNGLLERVQLRDQYSSKLQLEMRFPSYQEIEGISIPEQVEIDLPPDAAKIVLKVTNPKLNSLLPPKLFSFDIPSGYESAELR